MRNAVKVICRRSSFIVPSSALLFVVCLSNLCAGEPDMGQLGGPPGGPPAGAPQAQDLHELLVGHWREKGEKTAKLGEDQSEFFFGPDKCVVKTKSVQGESFAFYDYSIWQAWAVRRVLVLSLRDDAYAVKWLVDFSGPDRKQITIRERNKQTLAKPVTLIRVDDRTEPDK
jgi:hypothetical protein